MSDKLIRALVKPLVWKWMPAPLLFSAAFAAPALFPDLSPLAVWIGMASIGTLALVWWKADDMGGCETTLRAIEARDWLERMEPRRVW